MEKLDKLVDEKAIREKLDRNFGEVRDKFESARKTIEEKEEDMSKSIKKKPLEWVAGAFIGGLLLGSLFSRRR